MSKDLWVTYIINKRLKILNCATQLHIEETGIYG